MMSWLSAALLALGSLFIMLAALGAARMPDLFLRLHAAAKASSFGVALTLVGVALFFAETGVALKAVVIVSLIFLKTPVATHAIARAAYFLGIKMWAGAVVDEYRDSDPAKVRRKEAARLEK